MQRRLTLTVLFVCVLLAGGLTGAFTESAAAPESSAPTDAEIDQIMSRVRVIPDEFTGADYLFHVDSARLWVELGGFNTEEDDSRLRLSIYYSGDRWLFIHGYTFVVDGRRYRVPVANYEDVRRRVQPRGGITEQWAGGVAFRGPPMPIVCLEVVEALANCKRASVRYQGSEGSFDRVITQAELQAIRDMLAVWEVLPEYMTRHDRAENTKE